MQIKKNYNEFKFENNAHKYCIKNQIINNTQHTNKKLMRDCPLNPGRKGSTPLSQSGWALPQLQSPPLLKSQAPSQMHHIFVSFLYTSQRAPFFPSYPFIEVYMCVYFS